MIKLTRRDALKLIRGAINERGASYVYGEHFETCQNVVNGQPACIVGLSLWRFFEQLGGEQHMLDYRGGTVRSVAIDLRREGILDISKGALMMFSVAQNVQDHRGTWGDALNAAQEIEFMWGELKLNG